MSGSVYSAGAIKYNVSQSATADRIYMENYGRRDLIEIRPFRATLYNPSIVEDLSRVLAPPYDVIDEAGKERLRSRSPYNIVRLILPESAVDVDFWHRSAAFFRAWKKGEILVLDDSRCLYLHRQAFSFAPEGTFVRTGIIAALKCQELGRSILPHELTFPRTRSERLNLLRACRANFCQVFVVFRDPEEELLSIMEEAASGPPCLEFRDEEGVEHSLWRLPEGEETERISRYMADRKLIIADGHHRYETALAYSREGSSAGPAGDARRFLSVTLVRSEDPGLVILPVHRLLKVPVPAPEEAGERLERYFRVESLAGEEWSRRGLLSESLKVPGPPAFIMATRRGLWRLTLREGVRPDKVITGGESRRWKELDVSVLHALLFRECLGLDAGALAEDGLLSFTPWESTALDQVVEGGAEAAFLVRPVSIQDIWQIAEKGERMPHKSSYFHPKLPSGLVIFDHETAFG